MALRVTYFGALVIGGRVGNNNAHSVLEPSVMRTLWTYFEVVQS